MVFFGAGQCNFGSRRALRDGYQNLSLTRAQRAVRKKNLPAAELSDLVRLVWRIVFAGFYPSLTRQRFLVARALAPEAAQRRQSVTDMEEIGTRSVRKQSSKQTHKFHVDARVYIERGIFPVLPAAVPQEALHEGQTVTHDRGHPVRQG